MIKYILIFLFILFVCSGTLLDVKPWEPEKRTDKSAIKLHESYLEETRKNGSKIQIVFHGDSQIQGWNGAGKEVWKKHYAPLHAVNYGIGGDRTQHIIWRMEHGEIDGLHPKVVVLKIGGNNLGHGHTDQEIAQGMKKIIDTVHQKLPNTKLLLMGMFPRGSHNHSLAYDGPTRNINNLISKYANDTRVVFLDIGPHLRSEDGQHIKSDLYSADGVHLSKKGYEVWAEKMNPVLKKCLNASFTIPNYAKIVADEGYLISLMQIPDGESTDEVVP